MYKIFSSSVISFVNLIIRVAKEPIREERERFPPLEFLPMFCIVFFFLFRTSQPFGIGLSDDLSKLIL